MSKGKDAFLKWHFESTMLLKAHLIVQDVMDTHECPKADGRKLTAWDASYSYTASVEHGASVSKIRCGKCDASLSLLTS